MKKKSGSIDNEKRLIVITGGSGDIGRAITLEASSKNFFTCIGFNTRSNKAKQILEEVRDNGGDGLIFSLDLNNLGSFAKILRDLSNIGKLESLINCAGISSGRVSVVDQTYDEMKNILDTNLLGVISACRDFAKLKTEIKDTRQSSIVNISSLVAHTGGFKLATYAASKAGLTVFSKAFAREVGPLGIRVNAVLPGKISGSMNAKEINSALTDDIPIGRYGTPEEVAKLVIWLTSEDASYITGASIEVTGGK